MNYLILRKRTFNKKKISFKIFVLIIISPADIFLSPTYPIPVPFPIPLPNPPSFFFPIPPPLFFCSFFIPLPIPSPIIPFLTVHLT